MFTGNLLIPICICIILVVITLQKKRSVMATLVNRAVKRVHKEHLKRELGLLMKVFDQNGYSPKDIETIFIQ